jgi:hypothetical protein
MAADGLECNHMPAGGDEIISQYYRRRDEGPV